MKKLTLNKKKAVAQLILLNQASERQYWVHPINKLRDKIGDQVKLNLKYEKYPERFQKETRFTPGQFDELLLLLGDSIKKNETHRKPISPRVRLYVTLRYIGHGASMQQLSDSFCLGKSTVCNIINETTRAIWESLSPSFMPKMTTDDWQNIARDFEEIWNFPHCVGALDGKHCQIQKPGNSGSLYFNYKKVCSINLMGMCDAHYRFVMIDVGGYGRKNDSGVFRESPFGQQLLSGRMNLPQPKILEDSLLEFPYVIVADDAFPMMEHLFKPYPGTNLDFTKRIFNYSLSRARRTIENSFGIMASRFRIFRAPIIGNPENIDSIIKATCVLHNFLRTWDMKNSTSLYFGSTMVDEENIDDNTFIEGSWRKKTMEALKPLKRLGSNNYCQKVKILRDNLATYFVNTNVLSWQEKYVRNASYNPVKGDA